MPDDVTPASGPDDAAFHARVRQVVLERYGSFEAFEQSMNLPAGFVEREWLRGDLPREMVAEQVVRSLKCDRDWLMTGEGGSSATSSRKAPQVPDDPQPMPPSAQAVDTSVLRASAAGLHRPSKTAKFKVPPPKEKPAEKPAASTAADDPFSTRISASGDKSHFDDRTPPRPHNPPQLAQHNQPSDFDEFNVVIGSGKPDTDDGGHTTSRVNIPRPGVAIVDESSSFDSPGTTDSVIIEAVETDGDADRAKLQAIERQKNLLRQVPSRSGMEFSVVFRPVKGVASEFYDFIPFDKERLAIVVGDVAGTEGLETWGDTAMAMRSIRIFAKETQSPREILIKTNDELVPDLMAEANLTVVFSLLDLATGTLTTAQSGHQPVLLYNPKREPEPRQIKPGGMVLGLVRGPKFDQLLEEDVTSLREGDLLLWYTEGVPQTQNNRGQEFGIDSLAILLQSQGHRSPEGFLNFLMRRIDTWRGDGPQKADLTVVAMKVTGPLDSHPPSFD